MATCAASGQVEVVGMASSRKGGCGMKDDDNNNRERTLLLFETSKLSLEEFIKEWNARLSRRSVLLDKNLNTQYEAFEKLVKDRKLDSSLKKCTAVVRKMRQFQESHRSALEADIRNLNLTKYISEIALVVVKLRVINASGDIPSLVSVCSEIHTRYRDFSTQLLECFGNALLVEDLGSNTKLSSDLRLYTELLIAGVLKKEDGASLLLKTVQHLISLDSKDCSQLIPILVAFLRDMTDELLGTLPRDVRTSLEAHVCESQLQRCSSFGLSADNKATLKGVLKNYFHRVKAILVKKNDNVYGCAKYLRKLLETKGDIPPDRQKFHDELAGKLEKYAGHVGKLANLLDLPMPKLRHIAINPDEEFEQALLNAGEDGEGDGGGGGGALFEDEETRQFYQDFPDLVAYMFEKKNGLMLRRSSSRSQEACGKDSSDKNESEDEEDKCSCSSDSSVDINELDSDSEEEIDSEFENFDADAEKADLMQQDQQLPSDLDGNILPSLCDGGDISQDYSVVVEEIPILSPPPSGGQTKLSFQPYLANLKNCVNKAMIDRAAYDFVDNFKSRRCRMELAKHLFSLPRQRMDLLRLYSRLAATISQVYPEIGQEICKLLVRDFRFLVLKRDQQRLESKLRITRFIAELTIFGVFPKSEAFNCLKMLLRNFTHHQIEMTVSFLETCGRFLYKCRDSCRRIKLYLDEMLRRKTVQFLEPCYAYKVDCVYNQLCPSREGPTPKKIKSPLQAFMEYVLCYDLNRDTLERANKVLRMFHWKDPEKREMVVGVLASPWRLNHSQLNSAAALLASLKQLFPSVVQAVIENVSEVVRLGCEFESEDINNMRMSTCQYLAHLYNYKVISTTSLLNVMYYLISYGVTYQNDLYSKMDPPDSLQRVRIVCFMLRIVGDFVSTPRSNKRLDFFLKYFQRYYLYKRGLPVWEESVGRKQFPHYVGEMFEDTIKRVRGKWKFVKSVEEAVEDIVELDKKLREKVKNNQQVKRAINGERRVEVVGIKVREGTTTEKEKPVSFAAVACQPSGGRSSWNQKKGMETTGDLEPVKEEEEMEDDEEDEFEREFQAMCSESMSSEKISGGGNSGRRPDVPAAKVGGVSESGLDDLSVGLSRVKVTVLTKQNNKPREKTLEIETKEEFLVSIRQREDQEKREKLEVKSKTLALSQRQMEEEQGEKDKGMMEALGKFGRVSITSTRRGGGGGGRLGGH